MQHLEVSGTPVLYIYDALFLKVKNPGNGRLNNLNDPVLNVLTPTPFAPEIFCVYKTMQNRKLLKFCVLVGVYSTVVQASRYKPESCCFCSQ